VDQHVRRRHPLSDQCDRVSDRAERHHLHRELQSTYTLSCTDGITTLTDTLTGAIITNGRITGNAISFDLASSAAHQTGTVSGDTMSGTATWTLDLEASGTIILRGPFAGHRV
jgi:hypothetical protein